MKERATDPWTTTLPEVDAPDTEIERHDAVTAELPVRKPPTPVDGPHFFEPPKVPNGQSPPRALRLAVAVLFALSVLSLGALIAVAVQPAWFSTLRNTSGSPIASTRRGVPGSTKLAPSQGTGAAISSIQPSVAVAGETVAILGRGIMSPNGTIVARFGSEVAPTRCPSEERCLVTVPPEPGGSRSVPVRLQVGSGMSNALTFRYR
jgi:hypothetical protein